MRGHHPNSLRNLKKFEKGKSGNPSGRSKSFVKLSNELKMLGGEDVISGEWDSTILGTRRELVLNAIWDKAQEGDFKAIELLERLGCLE